MAATALILSAMVEYVESFQEKTMEHAPKQLFTIPDEQEATEFSDDEEKWKDPWIKGSWSHRTFKR
ncbi:hypothetical protein [Paenibacillus ihumii]|uniref:hypothetical protein n=1 Tax=Paenibacillus ihumii TaxID=687436 RepID=UPI0006D7FF57|nr:hypothetical protein [Paenibacillus ihumii]